MININSIVVEFLFLLNAIFYARLKCFEVYTFIYATKIQRAMGKVSF